MDGRSVNRIRTARFSHSVRGYDRHEVDQFLDELADWLERSGEGGADGEQTRAELERVGEQVASILTEAHDVARQIRDDATAQARQTLVKTNVTAESLRSDADEYAEKTREEGDAYGRKARADADAYAKETRSEADEYAQRTRAEADEYAAETRAAAEQGAGERREAAEREGEGIVAEATKRKRDVESLISDLEQRRDAVLAELERLASGIAGTATQHRGPARADGDETAPRPAAREPEAKPSKPAAGAAQPARKTD